MGMVRNHEIVQIVTAMKLKAVIENNLKKRHVGALKKEISFKVMKLIRTRYLSNNGRHKVSCFY